MSLFFLTDHQFFTESSWDLQLLLQQIQSQSPPSALTLRATLTRISEVEIVLDVAGDVVSPFVLDPVCVRLLVIPDENSKQNNHRNLPDEADCREADPDVGTPLPAEKIPHDAWCVCRRLSPQPGPRSGRAPWRASANISVQAQVEGCAQILHSHAGGGHLPAPRLTTPFQLCSVVWAPQQAVPRTWMTRKTTKQSLLLSFNQCSGHKREKGIYNEQIRKNPTPSEG